MKTLGFGFHLAGAAGAAAMLALALHPLGCAQGEQALSGGAGGGAATGSGGEATTATSSSAGTGGAGGAAPASTSAGTGGATTTSTGSGGSEPEDAGSRDSGPPDSGAPDSGPHDAGPPDSGPLDAGSTACTVFETSIECMAGWTVIFVGTTGSTGGHFTYVSENNCVDITDVNCNPTSSVGTSCDPTALGTMTVTHTPCDDSPPCTVTFPVVCP